MATNITQFVKERGRHRRSVYVAKIPAKLHECIWLYAQNWTQHIQIRHPEVSFDILTETLREPDFIYKPMYQNTDFYYQKELGGTEYRVVVVKKKKREEIVTAYPIQRWSRFDRHEVYCCYKQRSEEKTTF